VLIAHAVRAGAEFRERTRGDALVYEGGRVTGALVTEIGGERSEIRADVVVGADGKFSNVARWTGAEKYRAVPGQRPGYFGYFRGVEPRAEPTLEIWFGDGQIGFLFPMRPGEDCIALEVRAQDFEVFRASPRGEFESRIRALPGMAGRLRNARLEGRLMGVRSIENYFRKAYGDGWVLTGDAGYLKDPCTGLGLGDALQESLLLAESLGQWFSGSPWQAAMHAFEQKRDGLMLPHYESTLALTTMPDMAPHEVGVLSAILSSPPLTRSLAPPSDLRRGRAASDPGHLAEVRQSGADPAPHGERGAGLSGTAANPPRALDERRQSQGSVGGRARTSRSAPSEGPPPRPAGRGEWRQVSRRQAGTLGSSSTAASIRDCGTSTSSSLPAK
jgi:FAD binding domain